MKRSAVSLRPWPVPQPGVSAWIFTYFWDGPSPSLKRRETPRWKQGDLRCLALPPASTPKSARVGTTGRSSDSRKHRAPGLRSLENAVEVALSLPLSLNPAVGVTTSRLTCIQVHSSWTQHGSAQLFLIQQPIAKGQQCALRGRGGGGAAPPPRRRRPGTRAWDPEVTRVKGARPHCCEPQRC